MAETELGVLVHLRDQQGVIRGGESIQDVVDEWMAEGARYVRLTDPGDERAKVIPVDRILYVEQESGV